MRRGGWSKVSFWLAAAVLAAPAGVCAQATVLPVQFAGWTGQPNSQEIENEAPIQWVNLWKEAGRANGEFCEYNANGGKLDVSLQTYRDPSSAYEIYTALLTANMHPSVVWDLSGVAGERLIVLIGNYVLTVDGQQNASVADLQRLVKVVRKRADQTPYPPIRQYLPEGFSDGTQRYAQGPAGYAAALTSLHQERFASLAPEIGFPEAEVMLAEYRGRDSGVILLIDYPTPQVAEQRLHHLETALPGGAKSPAPITRRGSLLTLVLAANSPQYAAKLRDAVQYETQVTWNEGQHVLTDPPWVVILSRIFAATAAFVVLAIVLGIAFGGLRVLAKRLFPGKIFDRPENIEVLQLGLSGKPIDPRDFYSR